MLPFPRKKTLKKTLMETAENTSEYLLLFRNNSWHEDLSPDEIQDVMTEWMSWFDTLVADGRCRGGQSLEPDGIVVWGQNRQVTDGPYAEGKESVAGYFILQVADLAEATAIAQLCPGLPYGATVEVRKLMERCGASQGAESPASTHS